MSDKRRDSNGARLIAFSLQFMCFNSLEGCSLEEMFPDTLYKPTEFRIINIVISISLYLN